MALRATGQQAEVLAPGAGKLRATGQQVELLAPGDGSLRATGQQVELLCIYVQPVQYRHINDSLTFVDVIGVDINGVTVITDSLEFVQVIESSLNSYTVSDTLAFVDSLTVGITREFVIAQVFTLVDTFTDVINTYTITDTLSFSEIIDIDELGRFRNVSDELEFTQTAVGTIINLAGHLHDALTFTQVIYIQGLEHPVISDELVFVETIDYVVPLNIDVEMLMYWHYNAEGHADYLLDSSFEETIIWSREATRYDNNTVVLEQTISAVLEKASATSKTITDTLTFVDIISDTVNLDPDAITFVEVIEIDQCSNVADELTLTQVITKEFTSSPTVADTLSFVQQFDYTITETNVTRIYSPFIGETEDPDAPTTISESEETYTNYTSIMLFYPIETEATTITIDGPELGDIDRSEKSRVNRETRGGTLVVFSDPIWPQNRKLILTFNALSETEGTNILNLINSSLGDLVGLRDWYGRVWAGIIMNPDSSLSYNGTCNLSLQLEFECVRLWAEDYDDTLTLTDESVPLMVRSRTITDTPTLIDSFDPTMIRDRTGTDTLTLSDGLAVQATLNITLSDTLTLVDEFEVTNFLEDELVFVEEIVEVLN